MMDLNLTVEPIYGWGWTDGETHLETPEQFSVRAMQAENALTGVITSGEWDGRQVVMSKRHEGDFDGCVNVEIRSNGPHRACFGYGMISKDLLD